MDKIDPIISVPLWVSRASPTQKRSRDFWRPDLLIKTTGNETYDLSTTE